MPAELQAISCVATRKRGADMVWSIPCIPHTSRNGQQSKMCINPVYVWTERGPDITVSAIAHEARRGEKGRPRPPGKEQLVAAAGDLANVYDG